MPGSHRCFCSNSTSRDPGGGCPEWHLLLPDSHLMRRLSFEMGLASLSPRGGAPLLPGPQTSGGTRSDYSAWAPQRGVNPPFSAPSGHPASLQPPAGAQTDTSTIF